MGKGAGEIGDLSQHLARACIHTLLVDFLMLKKTLPSIEDPVLPQGARERERERLRGRERRENIQRMSATRSRDRDFMVGE